MTDIQSIKGRLKLEDLIAERYTIEGKGRQLTTQEHDSLKIRTDWQRWFWYSRGTSGDIVDWYMLANNCDFRQALEDLARRAGIELAPLTPERQQAIDEGRQRDHILRTAADHYHQQLMVSPDALAYCQEERGWTLATIKREHIGYTSHPSPTSHPSSTDNKHLSVTLREAGLLNHPMAKAVLSIPAGMIVYVHQERGRPIYLSGRSIEGKRHYNLPVELAGAKPVYTNDVDHLACDAHLLVEGQADAISLGQLGIPATALCGVDGAPVKATHIALDNDKAGQAAALDLALAVDPLARIVSWPKTLRHRLEGKGTINVKDANDLLKGDLNNAALIAILDDAPTAIQALATLAGKAKTDERKDLQARFFALFCALDDMTAADLKPDLADRLCGGISQFGRLLKAYQKQNEEEKKEEESLGRVEVCPGKAVGGYLFEQFVEWTQHGTPLTYYWVRYPNGELKRQMSVDIGNITYIPVNPDLDENIKEETVLFPSALDDSYRNEKDLLDDIRHFIHRWMDIDEYFERIASYYVLFSWFYDAGFETIPYIRALGEYGTGKTRFLESIGYLCFRPMLISGGDSEPIIFRMINLYRGTMVVDEADFKDSEANALIAKIINMGNRITGNIKRIGQTADGEEIMRVFKTFCPKVFASREGFQDKAMDSRCLTYFTTKSNPRPDIPIDTDRTFREGARRIRNKLAHYRLTTWQPAQIDHTLVDRTIMSRLAQVTLAIKMLVKDPEALGEMDYHIREYNRNLTDERSMGREAIVVQAIVEIWFRPEGLYEERDLTMQNIADKAQAILAAYDPDDKPFTARGITEILNNKLGLRDRENYNRRGDSRGRKVLKFSEAGLLDLMQRYGVEKPEK